MRQIIYDKVRNISEKYKGYIDTEDLMKEGLTNRQIGLLTAEEKLEKIAGLTASEAKEELLVKIDEEVRHETAMRVIEIESEMRENADMKAKEIISLAIQRCAADHTAEVTVTSVHVAQRRYEGTYYRTRRPQYPHN